MRAATAVLPPPTADRPAVLPPWCRLEREPLVIPTEFEAFLDWVAGDDFPEGMRASYLNHRLYLEDTVGDIDTHGGIKDEILRVLGNLAKAGSTGRAFGDDTLFVHRPNGLGNEPDVTYCTAESFTSGRVRVVERRPGVGGPMTVQGSPDLLVEVVSRSSVEKDTVTLRAEYLAAGVREYWVIDGRPEPHTFDLLTRDDGTVEWADAAVDAEGFRRSPVLGRRVRLDRGEAVGGGAAWDLLIQK